MHSILMGNQIRQVALFHNKSRIYIPKLFVEIYRFNYVTDANAFDVFSRKDSLYQACQFQCSFLVLHIYIYKILHMIKAPKNKLIHPSRIRIGCKNESETRTLGGPPDKPVAFTTKVLHETLFRSCFSLRRPHQHIYMCTNSELERSLGLCDGMNAIRHIRSLP